MFSLKNIPALCWLSVLIQLTACQPSIDNDLANYQARLANVLNVSAPATLSPTALGFPALSITGAPELNISLTDFYQLRHCTLYNLVAQRNTTLGKLQGPSQRYLYERHFLSALQQCLQNTENDDLRSQMQVWQNQKRMDLLLAWQKLLAGEEMRSALAGHQIKLSADENALFQATRAALTYLSGIGPQESGNGAVHLEQHLQILHQGQLPARVFRTRKKITVFFAQLTPWLEKQALDCNKDEQEITYLSNVFRIFFIEKIQPLAANINRYQYELLPLLTALYSSGPVPVVEWLEQQELEFVAFQTNLRRHVNWWQQLFKRCQISIPALQQPQTTTKPEY
ncbi:hypothetical protein GCM10009092_06800 [Bowmanella denitrificans]|uniref:DUF3080 domain-containing protein n=1 Tax=Bowmanella denitrificans TaxID=366582 RepID=A0ABP3GGF1_9ALTE